MISIPLCPATCSVCRELEERRRKEVNLRERLKDVAGGAGGEGFDDYKERTERELALLRAQNLALRRGDGNAASAPATARAPSAGGSGGTDRVATGDPVGVGLGGDNETTLLRAQLHSKWESEKKLQKRVGILEKRLSERDQEYEDMVSQVRRLREKEARDAERERLQKDSKEKAKVKEDSTIRAADRTQVGVLERCIEGIQIQ